MSDFIIEFGAIGIGLVDLHLFSETIKNHISIIHRIIKIILHIV